MADWALPFTARYRYMRVSRTTGLECERLTNIVRGGSITRKLGTDVFEDASLEYRGSFDIGADLIRVYLDATFEDGSNESCALGTFIVNSPQRKVGGGEDGGSLVLDGRLQELADTDFLKGFSLPAGTNAVEAACDIVADCGLRVQYDPCDYLLGSTLTFGLGDSGGDAKNKLEAVNTLLALAGYRSCQTDGMGTVLMVRDRSAERRCAKASFIEGKNARFEREVREELDRSSVCNVVKVSYSSQGDTVTGYAYDDDPASPYSIPSLGRERVAKYSFSESATQGVADSKAAELLATQRSVLRQVTVSHVYQPVSCGDVVCMRYASGAIFGNFEVAEQKISLADGCRATSVLQAYER